MSIKYSRGKNRLRSPLNSETPSNLKPLRYARTKQRRAEQLEQRAELREREDVRSGHEDDDEDQERPEQRVLLRPAADKAALERLQRFDIDQRKLRMVFAIVLVARR